ncbi:MAG: heavy metal translocating P-type ATPase [Candidatus Bipolaricaulota bacterium]
MARRDARPERALTLRVDGMHCASCAQAVERALGRVAGVERAEVDLVGGRARVTASDDVMLETLEQAVVAAGYSVSEAPDRGLDEEAARARAARRRALLAWALALPLVAWMLPEMVLGVRWPSALVFHVGMIVLSFPAVFIAGWPTLRSAWRTAVRLSPSMDTLIALGALASFATGPLTLLAHLRGGAMVADYSGIAAMIMAFHLTGRAVEASVRGRTTAALRSLLDVEARTARVVREGREEVISVRDLAVGDLMIVRPGEKIPTDGVVEWGESSIDESLATGESMPVVRGVGESLIGGTVNGEGALHVRATGVGEDTFLAQVARLVREAQSSKVPIQAFADRVVRWFVPAVVVLAAGTFAAWMWAPEVMARLAAPLAAHLPWVAEAAPVATRALYAAMAVLVIACPCALGLATPTALAAGVGLGARRGILLRRGDAVQRLSAVRVMALDKTGTVTVGRPEVTDVMAGEAGEREVLRLAAALEANSEHPVGQALCREAVRREIALPRAERFVALPGRGIAGTVEDRDVRIGHLDWMEAEGVAPREWAAVARRLESSGRSVVAVADRERGILGLFGVADAIKPEARASVAALRKLGLELILLSGDRVLTAEAVAREIGVDRVVAQVLPGEKADVIRDLRERTGHRVAMVGDGINDAPALAAADVGIALGTGTDVAMETADVTLVSGDLAGAARAVRLARATFRKIRQNLFWAFAYNIVAVPLAVLGLLHPLVAEAAMALSSINVVLNANRLRRAKLDG